MDPSEPDSLLYNSSIAAGFINPQLSPDQYWSLILYAAIMLILLLLSAMFSASENAFFSLSKKDIEELNDRQLKNSDNVVKLISHPQQLLATILIGNNLINVSFIILSSVWIDTVFNLKLNFYLEFFVKVISVTVLLLIFGEIIPKIYATRSAVKTALLLVLPITFCKNIFKPLIFVLVGMSTAIRKWNNPSPSGVSADELTHAIEITSDEDADEDEKEILKGIVTFGATTARQVMKMRLDVSAVEISLPFDKLLKTVTEWGYSRVPVYEDTFDNIIGILYIKDLLPFLKNEPSFNWSKLVKPAFFVPENKKLDDLLKDFQEKHIHMAIVVDEYGGKLGIVTMEDILEEIFGEINDEFDDETASFVKLAENQYVFEGKTLLNDVCKILEVPSDIFDEIKGEAETLAGMILEIEGRIPVKGETISTEDFIFTIESVDNRRIKKVKIDKKN